jgi:hypothetical protein
MISPYQKLSRNKKISLFLIEFGIIFSIPLIVGYSLRFLQTWFSTNFADNLSIFLSLTTLVSSGVLLFFGFILYIRTIHYETVIEYPSTIPEEDFANWRMLAGQIKARKDSLVYNMILALPALYIGYVLMFVSLWFVGSIARYHYLNFLSTLPAVQQAFFALGILIVVSLIFTALPMLFLINITNSFMSKYLGFPSDEDIIFAETLIINYRLSVKDRKGAKKELGAFFKSLTKFSRNWFNDKRKAYSQEFSKLLSNKSALNRLILFTPDSSIDEVRELFLNFGMSLRNWNDPECLKATKSLISKFDEYKPTSRIQKIASSIETYPKTITIVTIAVSIILFIVGYPQIASLIH